jgi:predicted nucleic acid-binding protein
MVLCDTNIISELARPRPNPGVLAWASTVSSIALSVISVEEIFYGLAWKPHAKIRAWFEEFLESRCAILPVTADVAKRCGHLRGELQAQGHARTQADMLIAATAQVHQLTLVTRHVQDFTDCHIPLLNPFRE